MKALKREMKLKGYGNKELAKRIGVSKTTIHNWLTGVCAPKPEHVNILLALGFSENVCLNPSKELEV